MVLTSETASQLRQAFSDGDARLITSQMFDGVTLAGLMELCCTFRWWGATRVNGATDLFADLTARLPLLGQVAPMFKNASRHPDHVAGPSLVNGEIVLQAFGNTDDLRIVTQAWGQFQDVFVRRLQQAGIERNWSYALASVLTEMVNNVPDHSRPPGQPMSALLVGCHIKRDCVHFAVSDLGDGALVSLHRNPRWQHLSGSRQALLAIIEKNATAKAEHPEGSGFRQLFAAFSNRGGAMRLLSDQAIAAVALSGNGEREVTTSTCATLPGMHVSASWLARNIPAETKLEENWLTHEHV